MFSKEWGAEFDPPMFTSHPSACMHQRNLTLPACAHQQQACHQNVVHAIGQSVQVKFAILSA